MGRRKIEIKAIKDDRNRSVTFLKRKGGLFKKAHELSVLCSVDVAVFVFGNNKKLYEYSSTDMRELISRYQFHGGPNEHKGPGDFNGGNDDDDDEDAEPSPPMAPEAMDMMPPTFQQPAPFHQMRHHTPSASPPIPNGSFASHQHHPQRGHTPQPSVGSRPVSRNDGLRIGPGMVPHGSHPAVSYMPTPPIYNHNHAQPNRGQPNHGQSNHGQSNHAQPNHAQPNHSQPIHGQPNHAQSNHAQPNHGHPPMVSQPGPQYPYPALAQQQQQQPSLPQSQPPPQPQAYMDDRRVSAPPSYASQTSHPMPAISRLERSPPLHPHHHAQSIPQISTTPPQSERREPQPPPPVEAMTEQQPGRAQPPLLNTDTAIKKLAPRRVHSIFTPIEDNRSILSQHLASFAGDGHAIKAESSLATTATHAHRPYSVDITSSAQTSSPPRSGDNGKSRTVSVSSVERIFTPPSRSDSFKTVTATANGARPRGPRLTVQIPDGGSDPGSATGGDSISPRPADTIAPPLHRQSSVVLPPPSPSASALLSAGASGPPNPFARPPPQPNHGETPVTALPSRFLGNDFFPSPSSFYNDWNFRAAGDNTLPSPLNFPTPVGATGPSFLREDYNASTTTTTSAGNSKRKSPESGNHVLAEGPDLSEPKRLKVTNSPI